MAKKQSIPKSNSLKIDSLSIVAVYHYICTFFAELFTKNPCLHM